MDNKGEIIARETLASDVGVILGVLRSKALLIAICTISAVLTAFAYTCFLPQVYSAQTVIQIEGEEQKVVKIESKWASTIRNRSLAHRRI